MSGEDANPLNRRLPAEVVTRQKREVKKIVENIDEVQVDLKTALALKPEARLKWLSKALRMVEDKRANSTELYDIVSNRKFCATMQSRNSQKLRGLILDNISIFSEKQRRFLRSEEWAPNKLFDEEDTKEDTTAAAKAAEDDRKPSPDSKPDEIKTDAKESKEDGGGGWTFTIRERPMPDPSTGKKRKKGAEDSEARFEAMAEKSEASQKKQEEDVDSSLALLERLNQQHHHQPPLVERERTRRERTPKKKRHLSRSKSISAASATSSSHRAKRGKAKKEERTQQKP